MNQTQNILKEKGIFLYQEKGDINRAGKYFLEWLNNNEDSIITEEIVDCFTNIFLEKLDVSTILSDENKLKFYSNFDESYEKLKTVSVRLEESNREINYVMVPWSFNNKDHYINVRISFKHIINDEKELYRGELIYGVSQCAIEDFIKKINPTNKCLSIKDFKNSPILRETMTHVLTGKLVDYKDL